MTTEPQAQANPFDISPVLRMYMESIETWRKNYENFAKSAKEMQTAYGAETGQATQRVEGAASAMDAALLNWQKSSEELFKRFVENQVEICRFFGNRWEQYLKLQGQVSHCRSLTELGNVQAQFLSQFANDYMHETEKLAQPVAEMMSSMANSKAA
jgi:predicted DNA-binding helix-hairpin-helix protein